MCGRQIAHDLWMSPIVFGGDTRCIDVWAGPNVNSLKFIFFNNYMLFFLFDVCCGYIVGYISLLKPVPLPTILLA